MTDKTEDTSLNTNRLEIFSDGVMAIIITIMVLELKIPHNPGFSALVSLWPVFIGYILSFIYIGIYWNNHHHMLAVTERVTGGIMWANLHLLFWISLIPFVTGWAGENHFAPLPMAAYGFVLLMCATAYALLQRIIVREVRNRKLLPKALGRDLKGKLSPLIYAIGIGMAFVSEALSGLIYAGVALMWLIPDIRIEHEIEKQEK